MEIDRRLYINTFALIFSFLVNLLINFFLTPYIVKNVGAEAYGFVGLANNIINYAQVFSVALNSLAARFIAISYHQNDYEKASKYMSSVLIGNLFCVAIISIVVFVLIINIDGFLHIEQFLIGDIKLLFILIYLNYIFITVFSVYNVATFIKNRLDLASIRNVISSIIRVAVLIFCFSLFNIHVYYIGLSVLLCSIYLFVSNFMLTKKLTPEISFSWKLYDFKLVKDVVSSGIWNSLSRLSDILSKGLDLLFVNLFVGGVAMGNLSISQTVPLIILSAFGLLASVFAPDITKSYAHGNIDDIKSNLIFSVKLFSLLSSLPLALFYSFGDIFYKLWMPEQDSQFLLTLSVLGTIDLCVVLLQEPMWNIFTVTNRLKETSLILLLFGALNSVSILIVAFLDLNVTFKLYLIVFSHCFWNVIRGLTFQPLYTAHLLGLNRKTFYPFILKNILLIVFLYSAFKGVRGFIIIDDWSSLIIVSLLCLVLGGMFNVFCVLTGTEQKKVFGKIIVKFRG